MKRLILKDVRLVGTFNIFLVLIPLISTIFAIFAENLYNTNIIYIFAIAIATAVLMIAITKIDLATNADILLISLPVSKFDIIKARYLTIFSYEIIILAIIYLSSQLVRLRLISLEIYALNIATLLFILSFLLVFFAIVLPLRYLSVRVAQFSNIFFYLLILLTISLEDKFNISPLGNNLLSWFSNLDLNINSIFILLLSLSLYVGSMFISKFIYERKEF